MDRERHGRLALRSFGVAPMWQGPDATGAGRRCGKPDLSPDAASGGVKPQVPQGTPQPVQRTGGCGAAVQPRGSAPMKSGSGPAWPPRAALLIPELILRDSLRTRCGTRAVARDTSPPSDQGRAVREATPRRPLARAFTALLRAAPGNGARAGRAGPYGFPKAQRSGFAAGCFRVCGLAGVRSRDGPLSSRPLRAAGSSGSRRCCRRS